MYNRLINFIQKKNILYDKQFGFNAHYSTDHAILIKSNQQSRKGAILVGYFLILHIAKPLTLLSIISQLKSQNSMESEELLKSGFLHTLAIDNNLFHCGRPEEPATLISTLLLQTHARQSYSLALVGLPPRMYGMQRT